MDHTEAHELLPLYAIDALSEPQRRAVEAHLDSPCQACRSELASYRDAAAELALSGQRLTPPESLKAEVLGRIRASADAPAATPAPPASRTGRAQAALWRGAVAAAIAAALLFGSTLLLRDGARDAPSPAGQPLANRPPTAPPGGESLAERVAEIEGRLGGGALRPVGSLADNRGSSAGFLLYDELAGELHLWLEVDPQGPRPNRVRLLGPADEVIAQAPLTIGEGFAGAVLPLEEPPSGGQVVLGRQAPSEGPDAPFEELRRLPIAAPEL
ncbi:zf-HC2 domain-containing protein [Botrimarina sp.]|uniref:zf-HC2 domain-containing protein n=1 Tax=Botrimarina sp. TaxID=2795802 RepID=UPI0032EAC1C1